MRFFAHSVIRPVVRHRNLNRICEIGASFGENTDELLRSSATTFVLIDPCIDTDLESKYATNRRVKVAKGTSLSVLPTITESFDCILIDGDHNWFTVYNELRLIHQRSLLAPGGLILLHDVGWPYGRRDMYYDPDTIPAEHRQVHARAGIVSGQSALSTTSGINDMRANANHEGGERNGVRTAVEDFACETEDYVSYFSNLEHGLGVLARRDSARSLGTFAYCVARLQAMATRERIRRLPRKKLAVAGLVAAAVMVAALQRRARSS